jgi:hypothetical protein
MSVTLRARQSGRCAALGNQRWATPGARLRTRCAPSATFGAADTPAALDDWYTQALEPSQHVGPIKVATLSGIPRCHPSYRFIWGRHYPRPVPDRPCCNTNDVYPVHLARQYHLGARQHTTAAQRPTRNTSSTQHPARNAYRGIQHQHPHPAAPSTQQRPAPSSARSALHPPRSASKAGSCPPGYAQLRAPTSVAAPSMRMPPR